MQVQVLLSAGFRNAVNVAKEGWKLCEIKVFSLLFMRSPMQRKYAAKAAHGARGE